MTSDQIQQLMTANNGRWPAMVIDFDAIAELDHIASRLIAAKTRYQSLFAQTSVPWPVIAVIHEREASQSWAANIAQGDPWNQVSVHVPRGEGPFGSWEEAAAHALVSDDHLDVWSDWTTAGGVLTALELYNGAGYFFRGFPSPYVWSRTNQYVSGKFVADGVFDSSAIDTQDGCAPLIARMMNQDPTIASDFGWNQPPAQPNLTAPDGTARDTSWLQNALNTLGANPTLSVDDAWGPATKSALRSYQVSAGMLGSGRFDLATEQSVQDALARLG